MDGLKEILEAFEARVRSKVVGSVTLAFIGANWKVIFYVIFAKKTAEEKFKYFDDNTCIFTLLVIPVLVGVLLALLLPLVNYWALRITAKVDRKLLDFKNESHSVNELSKLKYAAEREEYIARLKSATLQSAKADEETKRIQNPETRQEGRGEGEEVKDDNDWLFHEDHDLEKMPLEDLKDAIKNLDMELESLTEYLKGQSDYYDDQLLKQKQSGEVYRVEVSEAKSSGDNQKIQDLKIQRALDLQGYETEMGAARDQIVSLEFEVERLNNKKSNIISILEKRYDL